MPKFSLKAARVNAKLTISQVAEAVDKSESTIKSWEAGKTFPTPPMIDKLCELYGIAYDYIDFNPRS